jgi:hypothetical protein
VSVCERNRTVGEYGERGIQSAVCVMGVILITVIMLNILISQLLFYFLT